MLVHICCSVDSHYFLQELMKCYPDEKFIAFFYNPNIHPKEEYDLRLYDVKRSCKILGIDLIIGDYDFMMWFDNVKGLEEAEEKGERCNACFDIRLLKTAVLAMELGETKITTTLLASPMKSQESLFAQGDEVANKYGLSFVKIDVRSNGGTQKQSKMAKDSNLYRQNYCGCKYALDKQRNRANKISIELFEHIGGQILPASAKETISIFMRIAEFESDSIPYILQKNQIYTYRLLRATLSNGNIVIPSYIFTHSKSCKNVKSKQIQWHKIQYKNNKILLGFSDNMVFVDIESVNLALGKHYSNVTQMLYNPPLYDEELSFRDEILGTESVKPFVVIDKIINENLILNIESIFQNADKFSLIKL